MGAASEPARLLKIAAIEGGAKVARGLLLGREKPP
jgi:hypothetical protein